MSASVFALNFNIREVYGVFTLPDTDTDFTVADTSTDTDTMGLKPNCIGVGASVSMNTSTQFSTTH